MLRCFTPLIPVLLLLQGAKESSAVGQDENYLEKCCSLGSSWAEQKLRCESFAGPVSGVSEPDQAVCLETVDICCRKSFQEQSCEEGKASARAGLSCSRSGENVQPGQKRTSTGLEDYRRDCCEGCKLGILTGSSGKGCAFKKFNLGIPWEPAYTECCFETLSSTIRDITSSSTPSSSASTTSTAESESDELSFDLDATDPTEANSFKTDDLCKLMKGLLCSEICIPTPGSYYCKCSEGSVLQEDGRTCKSNTSTTTAEIIPVSTTNNTKTTPIVKFNILNASAKPRSTRSLPVEDNELSQSCPEGFRFSAESSMCDDIDECNEEPAVSCPAGTHCFNSNGSYQCLASPRDLDSEVPCEIGYRWNFTERRCLDVDECLENIHECMVETENCKNLEGSYECEVKCETGFIFNGDYGACFDVNECAESRNICPQAGTVCVNTQGSYECKKLREYQTGGAREEAPDASQAGSGRNGPRRGQVDYTSPEEEDIDECRVHSQPCAPGEICRNTQGGYDCIPATCPRGFLLVGGSCQDVDECAQGVHACAPYERCQNTNGSFTCELPRTTRAPYVSERPGLQCRKGYKVDTKIDSCVDIDECLEGPGCRDHERCQNLQGTYDCSPLCDPGWYFNIPTKSCQDVDECLLGHHSCRQRTQYCRNTNGSYVCEPLSACPAGYRRAPDGSCADVDECQEGLHACSRESYRYCVNLEGSYECITRLPSCPRGYEYSLLTRQCEDVDECRKGRALCNSRFNERCINLRGSYRCERPALDLRQQQRRRPACPEGLTYDAELRRCNIDECTEGTHNCAGRKCFNLPGSFQCAQLPRPVARRKNYSTATTGRDLSTVSAANNKCQTGSRYDAVRGGCIDVNECEELEDACSSNEECVNSVGSFKCNCRSGFYRDELTQACVDENECLRENDCLPAQRSPNTIGSYTCIRFLSCGTGYTLNSATENCEDDDECSLGTHDCLKGYQCRNTLGSYRCVKDRRTDGKTVKPTFRSTVATFTSPRTTQSTLSTEATQSPQSTAQKSSTDSTYRARITTSTPRTTSTTFPTTTSTTTTTVRTTTRSTPRYTPRTTPRTTPRSTTRSTLSTTRYSTVRTTPFTTTARTTTTTEEIPTVASLPTTKSKTTVISTYVPSCPNGYIRDRFTGVCKDADECADGTHKCKRNQTCKNQLGGYLCFCPKGYEMNRQNECVDIDECSYLPNIKICGSNSRCVNTLGSYRCICEAGYENDGAAGACHDVDECSTRTGLCQQECRNTWGGYSCHCRFGYQLKSDNHTCEDIDECTEYRDSNLCVGICDNTPGSYACRCPNGYRLGEDFRTCQDINECENPNLCRGAGEICQNVRGGYRCNKIQCPAGYILDPQRKNRCMRESPFCPVADRACFLRPSHYTYNYIAIVSMYPIPTSGQLDLFTMRGAYSFSSSMRFSMAFIQARAPPHVIPATESCFAMRKPSQSQAVLVLRQSLQGPQDIELEFSMEIYDPTGNFVGSAVAKIFIIVTQYEF